MAAKRNMAGDRHTRRHVLQIGALGLGGLGLVDVLRGRALSNEPRRPKSVIMIVLPGGPSHIDMYDLKPDAPGEYRGEFRPMSTKVAGMEICELFGEQAKIADKLTVVRGIDFGVDDQHELQLVTTGFPRSEGRPPVGSIVSRLREGQASDLPSFVSLRPGYHGRAIEEAEQPQYAGVGHAPFVPSARGIENLALARGVGPQRLTDRRQLLAGLDRLQRKLDRHDLMDGIDTFNRQALEMITSPKVRAAFDVSQEPQHVRDQYGAKLQVKSSTDAKLVPWDPSPFLQAVRLAEAGVPFISFCAGGWDHHGAAGVPKIFEGLRSILPPLDVAVAAMVRDLEARGLLQDVLVVMWGEMGRTPRISERGGRDHWPSAGFALLAGGGLSGGQVIGATDRKGERATGQPITPQNIVATMYRTLGINPSLTIADHGGRPRHLLDDATPIEMRG